MCTYIYDMCRRRLQRRIKHFEGGNCSFGRQTTWIMIAAAAAVNVLTIHYVRAYIKVYISHTYLYIMYMYIWCHTTYISLDQSGWCGLWWCGEGGRGGRVYRIPRAASAPWDWGERTPTYIGCILYIYVYIYTCINILCIHKLLLSKALKRPTVINHSSRVPSAVYARLGLRRRRERARHH